jgi:hypothetical protein
MTPRHPEASATNPWDRGWLVLGFVAFALYAFASIVPRGDTWGIHGLAFLHPSSRIAGLLACLLLLCPPVQVRVVDALGSMARSFRPRKFGNLLPLIVGCAGFVLFSALPVRTEVYGDTRTILRQWADNATVPSTWLASLFDLRLQQNDAALTQVLMRSVAHAFGLSIEQTFRIVSALAGAAWFGLWTQFVRTVLPSSRWSGLLVFVGLALGANQVFFGHVETYAFVFLAAMMLLLATYLLIERGGSAWMVGLLFVIALKAHAFVLCLVPALIFVALERLSHRWPSVKQALTWRSLTLILVAPAVAIGIALYVLHFKAVAAPYIGANGTSPPALLPLFHVLTPRDYSLFSPAHLVDLGNVLLLIGMPVLILLAGVILFHRRHVEWSHPTVKFAALAVLFPLLFLLAVNPLLSMPRDWDLYALLAGPLLLLLLAVLAHHDDVRLPGPALYSTAMAFSVFSMSFWILNTSPALLAPRLEFVGEHVFRTYHTSASYLIGTAHGMEPDTTKALSRRVAAVNRLASSVVPNDQEYTHMLMQLADTYRAREQKADAVRWVERAVEVAPDNDDLALYLVDFLMWSGDREQAERRIARVLSRTPGRFEALVLAAVIAVEKKDYPAALRFLTRAETAMPGNPDVREWRTTVLAMQERSTRGPGPAGAKRL